MPANNDHGQGAGTHSACKRLHTDESGTALGLASALLKGVEAACGLTMEQPFSLPFLQRKPRESAPDPARSDNCGDVFLARDALRQHRIEHELYVVRDGQEALDYIGRMGEPHAPYPDLILIKLNLPKVDGARVRRELRQVVRLTCHC